MKNGVAKKIAAPPNLANLIWQTADDVLRIDYKPNEYGNVVLPFTVLRRLDCVLDSTKPAVLAAAAKHAKAGIDIDYFLEKAADGLKFWNTSKFDFATLLNDSATIKQNMIAYVGGFSENVRDIFDNYKVIDLINDLARRDLLFALVKKFASVNLHPDVVLNPEMGFVFEELIRRFYEDSNEKAGEHYTPRDAVRLAVELLFTSDEDATLGNDSRIVTLYDPTAGTGGMLSVAEDHLAAMNSSLIVKPFGQEANEKTYAICKADMLIKGKEISNIALGDTLKKPAFENEKFDYLLSNPPYGISWKKAKDEVENEHKRLGMRGRFGPGLPRISDGQMLFLLHLISKMHEKETETSRIAIVMNASALFSGGPGSGESEIRKHVLENDLLEAIIGLPTSIFYNTGIATYIWLLSNNKEARRKGLVQLIDASGVYTPLRRNLGEKRRLLSDEQVKSISRSYGNFRESEICKITPNTAFGYKAVTVERPLRLNFQVSPERLERLDEDSSLEKAQVDIDELKHALIPLGSREMFTEREAFLRALDQALKKGKISLNSAAYKALWKALSEADAGAAICKDAKGNVEPSADLRFVEHVPLGEDIEAYFKREVKPFAPECWIAPSKPKIGYEIPFARHFFRYSPPRDLADINTDLRAVAHNIVEKVEGITN